MTPRLTQVLSSDDPEQGEAVGDVVIRRFWGRARTLPLREPAHRRGEPAPARDVTRDSTGARVVELARWARTR